MNGLERVLAALPVLPPVLLSGHLAAAVREDAFAEPADCPHHGADLLEEVAAGAPPGPSLLRCARCGLYVVSPRGRRPRGHVAPTAAALTALLGEQVARGVLAPDLRTFNALRNRACHLVPLRRLAPYRQHGRLLHAGCGVGALLHAAALDGWEPTGVELSLAAATYARVNLGLEVLDEVDALEALPAAAFDVALVTDVLEHLPSPGELLIALHRLLRPGGLLVVSTANADCLERRVEGARWSAVVPEHCSFYTREALRDCLQGLDFAPVRIDVAVVAVAELVADHRHDRETALRIAEILDGAPDPALLGPTLEVTATRAPAAA